MTLPLFLVLVLAGEPARPVLPALAPPGVPAGESCPPAHDRAADRVLTLLSSPLLPELKARYNLGTASPFNIQLLTNQADRDTCRALWGAVRATETDLRAGDRVSFYRSGDTYFVPITRSRRPARPGVVQLDGYSSLDVYDAAFRLTGRFGA